MAYLHKGDSRTCIFDRSLGINCSEAAVLLIRLVVEDGELLGVGGRVEALQRVKIVGGLELALSKGGVLAQLGHSPERVGHEKHRSDNQPLFHFSNIKII